MRTTTDLERLRRGVHPACAGLGHPFPYSNRLWDETINWGGAIYPWVLGLRLQAVNVEQHKGSAVIQSIREVQPQEGKLITVAARIFVDHFDQRFWFGVWTTQPNPLKQLPTHGLFFQQQRYTDNGDAATAIRARIISTDYDHSTDVLFDTPTHVYYDLAIVIHGTSKVDFVWQRYYHDDEHNLDHAMPSWGSFVHSTNVPTVSMRPSFLEWKPGSSVGGLYVRGLVVRETTLRE